MSSSAAIAVFSLFVVKMLFFVVKMSLFVVKMLFFVVKMSLFVVKMLFFTQMAMLEIRFRLV